MSSENRQAAYARLDVLREKLKDRFENVNRLVLGADPVPATREMVEKIRVFEKKNFDKTEHFEGEPF